MKKFFSEFKAFIKKGNIIDLAVAVVIGGAFNKIVSSLVNDIIMPLVSLCVGGANVTDWKWVIQKAVYDTEGNIVTAETALQYGVFIQAIIDFLIIALTVFIIVKVFKSSTERLTKISKKIIADTTELTKKQVKALKKKVKKAEKKGETVEVDKLVEEVKAEVPVPTEEVKAESVAEQPAPAEETKPVEGKVEPVEEQVPASEQSTQAVQSADAEMLSVLKEIRDSLKSNNK